MRRTRRRGTRRRALRRQRDVLCDVMLSAGECDVDSGGGWLTLEEIAKLTHYPPASISAQLRHLRKPQYGAFVVEKRRREAGEVLRGEEFGAVWEYRLRRGMRVLMEGGAPRGGSSGMAAQVVSC